MEQRLGTEYPRLFQAEDACQMRGEGHRVYAMDHFNEAKGKLTKRFIVATAARVYTEVILANNLHYRNLYEMVCGRRRAAMYMDLDLAVPARGIAAGVDAFGHVNSLLG